MYVLQSGAELTVFIPLFAGCGDFGCESPYVAEESVHAIIEVMF